MHFTGDCLQQLFGLICLVWQLKQQHFVTYADGWTGGWGPQVSHWGSHPHCRGREARSFSQLPEQYQVQRGVT